MVYLYIGVLVKYLVLVKHFEVGGLEYIHCCGHLIILKIGALFCLKVLPKARNTFFCQRINVCLTFSVDPWWVACALHVCSSSLRPPLALDKRIQRFTAKVSLCCKPPFKIGHEWKILILPLQIGTDLYFQRNCLQKSHSQVPQLPTEASGIPM